ncbi:unnamed protein product [Gongylonema pulchrum]|uniref:HRDC domain-containing protein n=1 Tax=Gongylonema pulchrum TaxID=637853 RepID=A0A3P7Q0E3_9BILA|nr:unnamed protein product [Gongylonema pulchrum]
MVLSHFDNAAKKQPPRAGCCDICDELINQENSANGASVTSTKDYGDEALILLRAIEIFQGSTGLGKVIDFIKGGQLEKKLFEIRTNLAIELDCGAHIIASNKCIQQLAMIRPSSVKNLYMIGEMTEERQRRFGQKLVDAIVEFCVAQDIPMNCVTDPTGDLAKQRAVSESTIAAYFVNYVKTGLPVHLDVVGISKKHMDVVHSTIRENGSDIVRLKPIMEKLPEGFIDYNRLKIIFGILEYEYGIEQDLKTNDTTSSTSAASPGEAKKRSVPDWMKNTQSSMQRKKMKKPNLFS